VAADVAVLAVPVTEPLKLPTNVVAVIEPEMFRLAALILPAESIISFAGLPTDSPCLALNFVVI